MNSCKLGMSVLLCVEWKAFGTMLTSRLSAKMLNQKSFLRSLTIDILDLLNVSNLASWDILILVAGGLRPVKNSVQSFATLSMDFTLVIFATFSLAFPLTMKVAQHDVQHDVSVVGLHSVLMQALLCPIYKVGSPYGSINSTL